MMKIAGLSHLFKGENLHNWWLTKYFFCPTVCVSYSHTAVLSRDSVCITHDEKYVLLRNTEYVERWYCYLFIGYIFFYMT